MPYPASVHTSPSLRVRPRLFTAVNRVDRAVSADEDGAGTRSDFSFANCGLVYSGGVRHKVWLVYRGKPARYLTSSPGSRVREVWRIADVPYVNRLFTAVNRRLIYLSRNSRCTVRPLRIYLRASGEWFTAVNPTPHQSEFGKQGPHADDLITVRPRNGHRSRASNAARPPHRSGGIVRFT